MAKRKKWTDTQIIQMYKEQGSVLKTLQTAHTCRKTIVDCLDRNRVAIYNSQLYMDNCDYLKTINSAEKAYWLGVAYGRGTLQNTSNGLQFRLPDREYLEQISYTIGYGSKVRKEEKGDMYIMSIINNKMRANLISHGMIPGGNYSQGVPKGVPEEFSLDFIRGLFDVRGKVSKESARNFWRASLHGNKELLDWVIQRIPHLARLSATSPEGYKITIMKLPEILKLYEVLYPEKCVHRVMMRKSFEAVKASSKEKADWWTLKRGRMENKRIVDAWLMLGAEESKRVGTGYNVYPPQHNSN